VEEVRAAPGRATVLDLHSLAVVSEDDKQVGAGPRALTAPQRLQHAGGEGQQAQQFERGTHGANGGIGGLAPIRPNDEAERERQEDCHGPEPHAAGDEQ